jgi:hypothetical protein
MGAVGGALCCAGIGQGRHTFISFGLFWLMVRI